MIGKAAAIAAALAAAGLATWVLSGADKAVPSLSPMALQAPPAGKKEKKKVKAVPVKVALTKRKSVPIRLEGVGTVKARSKVSIRARVDGQLFEAAVKEGQLVRKGDLLFRLDPRPFEAQVRQAEANIARDRANHDKAVNDVRRYKDLAAKGISPKLRLEETQAQVSALAATMRASEAALELARLDLGYATISAPIDGRVGNILVTPGNMVRATNGEALLVITEVKPIYVAFSLPEQQLDELRRRMKAGELRVDVTTMSGDAAPVTGSLFFINNEVDTGTGTIQVQARFANEDQRLIPGQFARASILLDELPNAITVPARAMQINRKGHYVWVMSPGNTVALRSVRIGPDAGTDVVVLEGLGDNDTVVTDGQLRLFPGASVTTGPAKPAKNRDAPKKPGADKDKTGEQAVPPPAKVKS